MQKKLVALAMVAVFAVFGVAFAQENTSAAPIENATNPSAAIENVVATQPTDIEKLPITDVPAVTNPVEEEVIIPEHTISEDPMTIEEMSSLRFFDIEKENVLTVAAGFENAIVKSVTGTVTLLAGNELQINVPALDNDFCFQCVEPWPYQLGDSVTVWVVIQAQN